MSERQLSRAIVKLATLLGWRVHTLSDSRSLRSHHPGFPDLVLVRGGVMLAMELKVGKRQPTSAQKEWLKALGVVPGITPYLVTDADWRSGWVERTLMKGDGRGRGG